MRRRRTGPGTLGLIAGAGALALAAAAAGLGLGKLPQAWLVGALFWSAFPLGALPVLCTHALTGGGWGEEAGPALRAAAATLPLVGVFFLPLIVFALNDLFSWTAPEETLPEAVQRKKLYLNVPFFVARSALYFAVWLVLAWRLGAWRRAAPPSRSTAAAGAIAWVVSMSCSPCPSRPFSAGG